MGNVNDFVKVIFYPISKALTLLGSLEIGGLSLLSILIGALIIRLLYAFFLGSINSLSDAFGSDSDKKHSKKVKNE